MTVIVVWTGWTLCRAWHEFVCIILYFRIFIYLLMYNYNMTMWPAIQRRNPTWPTCSTRNTRNSRQVSFVTFSVASYSLDMIYNYVCNMSPISTGSERSTTCSVYHSPTGDRDNSPIITLRKPGGFWYSRTFVQVLHTRRIRL